MGCVADPHLLSVSPCELGVSQHFYFRPTVLWFSELGPVTSVNNNTFSNRRTSFSGHPVIIQKGQLS